MDKREEYLKQDEKINCELRNLRFYKILGQNYEVLVNAILRGKDIYYEIPREYQMNTRKPLILDWLLKYGRPNEIAKVRSFGIVKLLCIYNAFLTWTEQNPIDVEKWIYKKEWDDYFKDNPKVSNKIKKFTPKKIPEPIPIEMPDFNFVTKQGNFATTSCEGDVYISIIAKKVRKTIKLKLTFHFRRNLAQKFSSNYVVFTRYENRIYFKSTTIDLGFKIYSKSKNSAQFCVTIEEEDVKEYEPFCKKELDLKYDKNFKMYYVEINESEVK